MGRIKAFIFFPQQLHSDHEYSYKSIDVKSFFLVKKHSRIVLKYYVPLLGLKILIFVQN